MKAVATIGLDIAKQVFQVNGAEKMGRVVLRRRLRLNEVVRFFSELEPCFVGIEASGGLPGEICTSGNETNWYGGDVFLSRENPRSLANKLNKVRQNTSAGSNSFILH